MVRLGRARGALVAVAAALLVSLLAPTSKATEEIRVVPVPDVEAVPDDAGIRGAQGFHHESPANVGYTEHEFFISGTAKSYGAATGEAPFKTRLLVMAPATPAKFNGTVMVEWLNVTGQNDAAVMWPDTHDYLIREGYAWVGVTAQRAGQGPSPQALKAYDPVRYESLSHPGDDYSWDIFSQAAQAIRSGSPAPLGELTPEYLIAAGQSQSGSRLASYLRKVHREALREPPRRHPSHRRQTARRVFDGVLPVASGTGSFEDDPIPTDLDPIFWIITQNEASSVQQPDGGNFRLIEISGAPHGNWFGLYQGTGWFARNYTQTAANPGTSAWDRETGAQYGERGGGACPRGFFPSRFAYAAAIDHLNEWVRTGVAPKSWPRIERDASNAFVKDEYGNVKGGFRLPVLDVPVATYNTCFLFGQTDMLPADVLADLYPTHEDYVAKMKAAVAAAVDDGTLLPPDAAELIARADASNIGRQAPLPLAAP